MASVVSTDIAQHYQWGENCDGWHLVKSPMLSVIKERVPPGCGEVLHFHQHAEQFFYILSGEAVIEAEGVAHSLGVDQGLHIPAGTPHQLKNRGHSDLVFVVTSVPPSHGDRIELPG